MKLKLLYLGAIAFFLLTSCNNQKKMEKTKESDMEMELTMLVGTYTSGSSKGIYSYRFNQETGEFKFLGDVDIPNPSYLALSADNNYVFAVSENGDETDAITSFRFDKEKGKLEKINTQLTDGVAPCYVATDGKYIVTANYGGGNISVFQTDVDGKLLPMTDIINFVGAGPDKKRQASPHLHCVMFSPDGKYLFANDLGTDHIYKFQLNRVGEGDPLVPGTPSNYTLKAGSGPRHLAFSSNGKYAYLITELSGEVVAFQYNDGDLKEIQTVVADSVGARGSADIHISPDGKFLYASNRLQADGLAIFSINESDGMLTKAGYQPTGIHPRNFIITPNGKYLLVTCRDSNAIEVYQRDQESGLLVNIGQNIEVDKPVCLKFAY